VSQELYSVVDVALALGLHVKTVRNFVREGRLKATRIGKQYRIARADLEAFTGQPAGALDRNAVRRHRHVEASCIVDIEAISPDAAAAVRDALQTIARTRQGDQPLRIETIYDDERGRLKIIAIGGAHANAELLAMVSALVERRS
jgi:excisionase family DNA binding protein